MSHFGIKLVSLPRAVLGAALVAAMVPSSRAAEEADYPHDVVALVPTARFAAAVDTGPRSGLGDDSAYPHAEPNRMTAAPAQPDAFAPRLAQDAHEPAGR